MNKFARPSIETKELIGFIRSKVRENGCNEQSLTEDLIEEKGLSEDGSKQLVQRLSKKIIKKKCPSVTRLELMVTEDCNLNCKYCFVSYKNKINRMTKAVAGRSIDFLLSNSGRKRKLSVFFMGGEPLLEFDLIRYAVEYSKKKLKGSNKKIDFSFTTNGTLLNEKILKYLKENKISFMLSLDGAADTQDMYRKFSSGKGSYQKIANAIPLIKNYFPTFPVRVTPMPESVSRLYNNIKHLSTNLDLDSFVIGPASGVHWDKKSLDVFEEQMIETLNWTREELEKNKKVTILNLKPDFDNPEKLKNTWGCQAGRSSVVVTPEGICYPCAKMLGLNSEKGIYPLGDVHNGITEIYNRLVLSGLIKVNRRKCNKCSVKTHCTGGCYASNFEETGNIFTSSPQSCKISMIYSSLCDNAESVLDKNTLKT